MALTRLLETQSRRRHDGPTSLDDFSEEDTDAGYDNRAKKTSGPLAHIRKRRPSYVVGYLL